MHYIAERGDILDAVGAELVDVYHAFDEDLLRALVASASGEQVAQAVGRGAGPETLERPVATACSPADPYTHRRKGRA